MQHHMFLMFQRPICMHDQLLRLLGADFACEAIASIVAVSEAVR